MRASCVGLVLALVPATAFVPRGASRLSGGRRPAAATARGVPLRAADEAVEAERSKKMERRRIMQKDNFYRGMFKENEAEIKDDLSGDFYSDKLPAETGDSSKLRMQKMGELTLVYAEKLGLCWGAERAVEIALSARAKFPEKKTHITNEILHNPGVNQRLSDAGIEFIQQEGTNGEKDWEGVGSGDMVILPAFGAKLDEMQRLDDLGVTMIDTTCPWVSKVWGVVDKHKAKGLTSIIHGKWQHEEAIATASFAEKFLIIKNIKEAQFICDYVEKGGNREEFFALFDERAYSPGFDPDEDLKKIGLANQTTMYKGETKAIGRMLERSVLAKYGPEELSSRYLEFDTICDATQERQDAILDMISEEALEKTPLDLILVVGGFDSSNTAHLLELPHERGLTCYHIDCAERIRPDNSIEHRLVDGSVVVTKPFLPAGKVTLGVTSGASTPDAYLVEAIETAVLVHKVATAAAADEAVSA